MWNWFEKKENPPPEPADPAQKKGRPTTYWAEKENLALNRPEVFDPALKHFPWGYRAGEPQFDTLTEAQKWHQLRELVLHMILKSVQDSKYADHLILRGSTTLRSWLGDRARPPGDIDWVVTPASWQLNDRESRQLIDGVVGLLRGSVIHDLLQIPDRPFVMEDIWTYEKAPGRRMIVPWRADKSTFDGTVQMDFVFGEPVTSLPVITDIIISDLPPFQMLTASREQSLAWKLLWLATDSYAMGKDLYDAVLLAETTQLELPLLKRTFDAAGTSLTNPWAGFSKKEFRQLYVEWEDFQKEYPHITGTRQEWTDRLIAALEPIWKQIEPAQ